MRIQLGNTIGINLIKKIYLGDSHQEAYHLLFKKRKGIQERANFAFREKLSPLDNNVNWYQIIYRVTKNAIKGCKHLNSDFKKKLKARAKSSTKSLECCLNPDNEEIFEMEELFVVGVLEVIIAIYKEAAPEKWELLEKEMESPDLDPIIEKLVNAGFVHENVTRLIALHVLKEGDFTEPLFEVLEKWCNDKREGRGKDRARLLVPLALLGVQITLFTAFAIITPALAIPIAMLSANSLSYVLRDTPGKLLSPMIALTMQRVTLACHDIKIEKYSLTREAIPDYTDENAETLKLLVREY